MNQFLAFVCCVLCACTKENADLLIVNARIYPMQDSLQTVEALAIRDGRVLALGTTDEILGNFVSRKVEDAKGLTVLPGFNDAHLHLLGLGRALQRVDLVGTKSYEEVRTRVQARADQTAGGEWILGRGWDQNDWPDKSFPTHESLSAITPRHFVAIRRVDGHAVLVNKSVLDLAGIDASTKDPSGGKILRDSRGNPTGVLIDNAMALVERLVPAPSAAQDSAALELAIESCLSVGLTSVQDPGVDSSDIEVYNKLGHAGRLRLRASLMLDGSNAALLKNYFSAGPQRDLFRHRLNIAAVKLYADGALGSRGAALLAPYTDEPTHSGLLLTDPKEIQQITIDGLRAGFQICTHAIGDRGNHSTLDAYAEALRVTGVKESRLRIEHAQVVALADIDRFAELGIIASMQPTHCTSDLYWAEKRVGPQRILGAYAWRTMIDKGIVVAGGSDAPVESNRPLWGLYAAVTRTDHDGFPNGGWYPDQKLTRAEAVRIFTRNAAYAEFEESFKGTLAPGMAADLVVLSHDIFAIDPLDILHAEVDMTMVDGEIVYRKMK